MTALVFCERFQSILTVPNQITSCFCSLSDIVNKIFKNFKQQLDGIRVQLFNHMCFFINEVSGGYSCSELSNQEKIDGIRLNFEFKAILNYTRKIKSNSEMSLIEAKSTYVINNSSIEQEFKTSEWSRKYSTSKSTTMASSMEFTSGKSTSFNLGIEKGPFEIGGEITLTSSLTSSGSESRTIEIIEETTITSPAQAVKVRPHSKVLATSSFYTYLETTVYLMDLEISRKYTSYIGFRDPRNRRSFYEDIGFNSIRTGYIFFRKNKNLYPSEKDSYENDEDPLIESDEELGDDGEDSIKLAIKNGKYCVINMPVVVKKTVYHVESTIGADTPI